MYLFLEVALDVLADSWIAERYMNHRVTAIQHQWNTGPISTPFLE
jgi:hypothetical protein